MVIMLINPFCNYCKLVIIRRVPIFAIFVSAINDEFTYSDEYKYYWLHENDSQFVKESIIIHDLQIFTASSIKA